MTTFPGHAHKGRCVYNSTVHPQQVLQLLHFNKSKVKLTMTKALGGTNHYGKRSYGQVVTTGNQITSHSPYASSKILPVNSVMGSNHSHAKQWNRSNRSLYSAVSHKVSAQSSNQTIVHRNNGTGTKVLYKEGNIAHHGRQASVNVQGKSYPSCSSTKSNPEQGILVYKKYHILQPIDNNCDNDQPGITDKSECQYQSGSKNTSSVAKTKNKEDTDLSCRIHMDNKPYPSQSNWVRGVDSLHSKAVNSLHKNTANTKPCQEFLLCQQQLNTAFGCVPLTAIKTYQGPVKIWNVIPDLFTAHTKIKASHLPNF